MVLFVWWFCDAFLVGFIGGVWWGLMVLGGFVDVIFWCICFVGFRFWCLMPFVVVLFCVGFFVPSEFLCLVCSLEWFQLVLRVRNSFQTCVAM